MFDVTRTNTVLPIWMKFGISTCRLPDIWNNTVDNFTPILLRDRDKISDHPVGRYRAPIFSVVLKGPQTRASHGLES